MRNSTARRRLPGAEGLENCIKRVNKTGPIFIRRNDVNVTEGGKGKRLNQIYVFTVRVAVAKHDRSARKERGKRVSIREAFSSGGFCYRARTLLPLCIA